MENKLSYFNYEDLLEQAKTGKKIPEAILQKIREQLESGDYETDLYTLLHIIGKANDRKSLPIVMEYVDYGLDDPEDDGMIRRIVLQILGRMWLVPDAFEIVAQKAFYDPSPFVCMVAATAIGILGANYPNLKTKAAKLLLQGFDQYQTEDQEIWESFYDGLLELLEVPINKWPLAIGELKKEDIDWNLIEKAKSMTK